MKFRTANCESGERYSQFAECLRGYVNRWVELDVLDLFVSEQVLEMADKDLALFLKEHKPKCLSELIKTTYQYVVDLRERLQSTCDLAREELEKL